jgi:hypothetical protein
MECFVKHNDYPDVPVRTWIAKPIQMLLTEQFGGARESDVEKVAARIVHDVAM